jgi:large subunit ribosomal protein L18e
VTNPELTATVRALRKASKKGAALWGALADELGRPRRGRVAVNLSVINRYTGEGDVVAVPGKVIGSGEIAHAVTVAAFSFSETAREKIARADGKTLSLTELVDGGVEPSKIKILK